ncbi:uncharacterized protein HaLaN_15387, partial [Haematococcus lacustris]
MRLRMFRQFKMWKAFKVWRRGVASRKATASRHGLAKHLFVLHPIFRAAILREACVQALELLEQSLLAGKEKRTTTGTSTVRLAVQKAVQLAGEAEFSYAINAARRSERRRIHNF